MFLAKLNEALTSEKSFLRDRLNAYGFGISGLLNIIHWLTLYIKIKPGQSNILLHYNVVVGPDLIQKSIYAYFIPLLALVILILNFTIARIFYRKEKLSSYFLSLSTVVVQAVFFAATIILIIIND